MFSISIPGLFAVSAPDMETLETLITRAGVLRQEHVQTAHTVPGKVAIAAPVAFYPNLAEWEKVHGKRLRMTKEEQAEFGHLEKEAARESAAIARLESDGIPSISGGLLARQEAGPAPGATVQVEIDTDDLV